VAELYDPTTDGWIATGATNVAHFDPTLTRLLDGRVVIASGRTSEVYDPASGTWTVAGNLTDHRDRHQASLLLDGRVLVTGGYQGCMKTSAELFDPATGQWSPTATPMLTPRADHKSVLLADGRVLVVGGDDDCGSPKARFQAELFDPATNSFSATGNLNVGRDHLAGARLPDGRVLVAGGSNGFGTTFASAELYDPTSGIWSLTGSMHRARFVTLGDAAVPLPDGTVLIADGTDQDPSTGALQDCATSEIYDPVAGVWSPPVPLVVRRCHGSVVLLADGQPMIISGNDCVSGTNKLRTAEVYTP
jgi:hypothetical protein